jgi:colanic acid/amylovoran biosynthesis glycosyltransferase
MNVAIISSRFPGRGETFLGTELKELRGHFESVTVIPARGELFSRSTLRDAAATVRAHPRRFLKTLRKVVAGSRRPSVLAKNLVVLPRALAVARMVERQGIDHIHAYWLSAPATVAYIASEMTGTPWSSTAHAWDIYEDNLIRHKAKTARFIRAISDRGARDLSGFMERKDADKVTRVFVGVEIGQSEAPKSTKPLRFLCAANLVGKKGHMDLLAALKIVADSGIDFRCDVAGDGPLRNALERRIAELGLQDRVLMLGRVDHAKLLARLRHGDYDLKLLASRNEGGGYMEGIPVALMEAMAAGIPCVATDSGGIPELIDAGCGVVVTAHDSRAIAAGILRLSRSPELRASMGRLARTRVAEHFNVQRTIPTLARLVKAS